MENSDEHKEYIKRRKLCLVLASNLIIESSSLMTYFSSCPPRTWKKRDPVDWKNTNWWKLISNPAVADSNSREGKTFRCRFRLPFRLFQYVVDICKKDRVFGRVHNAAKLESMPVELKVLGVLRTLGRATLHDDVAELSGASAETHRKCFLQFIEHFKKKYYKEFISLPSGETLERTLREYSLLGFEGIHRYI